MGDATNRQLPTQHWIAILEQNAIGTNEWIEATEELAALGLSIVPGLIESLANDYHSARIGIQKTLKMIGAACTYDLAAALRDEDESIRESVIQVLYMLGKNAVDALPAIVDALRDDCNDRVRYDAATTINLLGEDAVSAIPTLIEALRDSADGVREHSANALGSIGAAAEAALSPLLRLRGDPEPSVREAASDAIDRIRRVTQRGERWD